MSASIDQIAENIVRNDVHANISGLIGELLQQDHYVDDLMEVIVQRDYVEPALEHLDNIEADDTDIEIARDLTDYYETNAVRIAIEYDPGLAEEFCDMAGIEPHEHEALEHWIISDYLADHLEHQGESVIRDFYGLTIWGRTTSGQAIDMDGVIRRIAENIQV